MIMLITPQIVTALIATNQCLRVIADQGKEGVALFKYERLSAKIPLLWRIPNSFKTRTINITNWNTMGFETPINISICINPCERPPNRTWYLINDILIVITLDAIIIRYTAQKLFIAE